MTVSEPKQVADGQWRVLVRNGATGERIAFVYGATPVEAHQRAHILVKALLGL